MAKKKTTRKALQKRARGVKKTASKKTPAALQEFKSSILKLIIETSVNLPPDVRRALQEAIDRETPGTQSALALQAMAVNTDLACDAEAPICQDTGMPTFEIKTPVGMNQIKLRVEIEEAIAEATKLGKLRPNAVDSLTGKNSGTNLGIGCPVVHFSQWEKNEIEVRLILKEGAVKIKIFNIRCLASCRIWGAPTAR